MAVPKKPPKLEAPSDLEGFSVVPEAFLPLFKQHLAASEIIVLLALLRRQVSVNRYSRPVAEIARVTGLSEGTVRNAQSSLVDKGFLEKAGGGYRGHTASYRVAVRSKSVTDWLPKTKGEQEPEQAESVTESVIQSVIEPVTPKEVIEATPPSPSF